MDRLKVLVTGSKGFIGKHLCSRIKESESLVLGKANKYEMKLDVMSKRTLQEVESGINVVIHLAAKSSVVESFRMPYETYHTNIIGTLNLLELARLRNIQKFIFVSTYVYGQPEYLPVDEKHPVNPHSPYNQSKLVAEQLCRYYSDNYGIGIVVIRPFSIYGPNSRSNSFISSIIRQISQNGNVSLSGYKTRRDFLFIDDFINLIELILNKFPSGYNIFNVGYGRAYTLEEVSRYVGRIMKKKISLHYDQNIRIQDVTDMVADISKVSREFKWKPITSLRKGLKLSVKNSLSERHDS